MSHLATRAVNMLKLSFLGDAATMPLHWIYNQADLASKVGDHDPLFFPTPSCPFYTYPSGVFSPYGYESVPFLTAIADTGVFDRDVTAQTAYTAYKAYTDANIMGYAGRLNHVMKELITQHEVGKPWSECNTDDSQANGMAKVPIIVARYAGSAELTNAVEQMVSVLQRSSLSVESSVLIAKYLERLLFKSESASPSPATILASMLEDADVIGLSAWQRQVLSFVFNDIALQDWLQFVRALDTVPNPDAEKDGFRNMRIQGKLLSQRLVSENIAEAIATSPALTVSEREVAEAAILAAQTITSGTPSSSTIDQVKDMARALGLSCALPSALLNVFYLVRYAKSGQEALTWNILIGGDNCSRAAVLGAIYGIVGDMSSETIETWIRTKMHPPTWSLIDGHIEKVVKYNSVF
jgi:ADP-ribosylglycohydrolase